MKQLLVVLMLIFGSRSYADDFEPSHDCDKPFKPYEFTSRFELEMFREEVRAFKACIEEFVEEQEQAVKRHRDAAEEALDEWNSFVRLEL